MIFQPPFPEPIPSTIIEAEAIISIGLMFADILIIFFLLMLMIYLFKKVESNLPIIVVYFFSILMGLESLSHFHTHFSPTIEIFFLIFQTSIFIMKALEFDKSRKRKAGR